MGIFLTDVQLILALEGGKLVISAAKAALGAIVLFLCENVRLFLFHKETFQVAHYFKTATEWYRSPDKIFL